MTQSFDKNPILNSPYRKPERHWQLDNTGKPTGGVEKARRESKYFVPIPASQNTKRKMQGQSDFESQTPNPIVNRIREFVDFWRALPPDKWGVTPVTKRLLLHWREGDIEPRPFFCQVEAVETFILLNEVARNTPEGQSILKGNDDESISTKETDDEMLTRACKELPRSKNIVVINDEAHHCYRHKVKDSEARFSAEEKNTKRDGELNF